MTSPENTKRANYPRNRGNETDPASNRSMFASDIREAYADYVDRMQRFEWLDRALIENADHRGAERRLIRGCPPASPP